MRGYREAVSSSVASISRVRRKVREFARVAFSDPGLTEIELAVGEALANSAEHGGAGEIRVRCWFTEASLVVEIEDDGEGFNEVTILDRPRHPQDPAPRGYGLMIMRHSMDRVQFGDRGRRVRLTKLLAPSNPRFSLSEPTLG
jgi:anti-sigma regulatory factor (Ser/Thr protein kinase)